MKERLCEANGSSFFIWDKPQAAAVSFLQNKENHGLVEKLTSLAAVRAGEVEKMQRLELELDRAAAHRHTYEEKGKRYKAALEEVCAECGSGHTWESSHGRDHSAALSTRPSSAEQGRLCCGLPFSEGAPLLEEGRAEP